jgi:hypothetical protein
VLSTLTTFLLQHKQVAIPHIGSFELIHRPATLDFANRLILPPAEEIVYSKSDLVTERQKTYLSEVLNISAADVSQQLENLGHQLKESLGQQGFEWRGIGKLEQGGTGVVFNSLFKNKLAPVEAHKVMRENVSHSVTVGDREMQSHEAAELLQEEAPKSYLMIIVWILIAMALLFIGYLFYTKGFSPLSSGSQQRFGFVQSEPLNLC